MKKTRRHRRTHPRIYIKELSINVNYRDAERILNSPDWEEKEVDALEDRLADYVKDKQEIKNVLYRVLSRNHGYKVVIGKDGRKRVYPTRV